MTKHTVTAGPKVLLGYRADDWELFNLPGREGAAAALNSGLASIIAAAPTYDDVDWIAVENLLQKHNDFGAGDSEGRRMAERIIANTYAVRPGQRF